MKGTGKSDVCTKFIWGEGTSNQYLYWIKDLQFPGTISNVLGSNEFHRHKGNLCQGQRGSGHGQGLVGAVETGHGGNRGHGGETVMAGICPRKGCACTPGPAMEQRQGEHSLPPASRASGLPFCEFPQHLPQQHSRVKKKSCSSFTTNSQATQNLPTQEHFRAGGPEN